MNVDIAGMATAADDALKAVMRVEPMIATGVGMFVPGAAPVLAIVQPMVVMAAPFIEQALEALAKNNGGDAFKALFELVQHITSGQPNSGTLSGPTADPSTLGTG